MSGAWMVLAAIAVLALSGVPGFVLTPRSSFGQRTAAMLMTGGSALGLYGVAVSSGVATPPSVSFAWGLPWGRFVVAVDPVSAVFLVLVFVVPALGSIYGLEYWRQSEHPTTGPRLVLFQGLLSASMAMVVIARDGVLFLIAWEIMALAAYFAATVDEDDADVRRAGWVYLIATHAGTLCLISMFALWRHATGSFELEPVTAIAPGLTAAMLLLALIGFGGKAGIMPLHVWLPGTHAGAPSHVSAVMSGVMLKIGIYGIVRVTMLLPTASAWWGSALLVLGAITGVAGIAFAIGQHDLKRLLAYSSIENIGIITMGLGLALLGRTFDRPDWILLGLGGALLHVWNHGLFKSLLFLGAGAVIHTTHSREIDRLGGLAKDMPRVTGLFVLGAVAICGLPPLNGFVSEWMLYLGLFRTLGSGAGSASAPAAAGAVALAMIGALALACFVKLIGSVFLGSARDTRCDSGQDPSPCMLMPMSALACGCACLGLFPAVAAPAIENAARAWSGAEGKTAVSICALAPLASLSAAGLVLVVSVSVLTSIARWMPQAVDTRGAGTWDCGYARPTARMQYSGSSLVRILVVQFRLILWPRSRRSVIEGPFPASATFHSEVPDPVLERILLPFFRIAGRVLTKARVFQQGQTQAYVLYVLIALIALLVWGPLGGQP